MTYPNEGRQLRYEEDDDDDESGEENTVDVSWTADLSQGNPNPPVPDVANSRFTTNAYTNSVTRQSSFFINNGIPQAPYQVTENLSRNLRSPVFENFRGRIPSRLPGQLNGFPLILELNRFVQEPASISYIPDQPLEGREYLQFRE